MHTVSKSLLTLSICLSLSGAVYAQTAPSAAKPAAATEPAKAKPASTTPAAVSGETASQAVKAKHEHAHAAPKPALDKAAKPESVDAKKLETSPVKENKSVVTKPEAKKAAEPAKQIEHAAAPNVHKPMKHESKPVETGKPAETAKTVK